MGTDAQIFLCDHWRTKRTDTCTGECQRPDRAVWMEVNLFDKDLPTGATASILKVSKIPFVCLRITKDGSMARAINLGGVV
jgi:hypothetical protein